MRFHPCEWLPEYSVGNEKLDNQHKKLLRICGEIQTMLENPDDNHSDQYHHVINDLCVYADEHFKAEEELLEKNAYPELATQKREHMQFIDNLSGILFNATQGKLDVSELNKFTSEWMVDHILNQDMKYKPYLS